MQSTGHTSTQALSLTLMQGSAITYGIGDLPISLSGLVRPRLFNSAARDCQVFRALKRISLRSEARVQRVPERVPEQVEREHREADSDARENRHPGRRLRELDGGAAKHQAPRRQWLLHAEPEERQ